MRQPYEQNLDLNYKPELSYEDCLRIVKGLEAVRKCHLTNSPIVERAARFMQRNNWYQRDPRNVNNLTCYLFLTVEQWA